jgi:hypothetical protein
MRTITSTRWRTIAVLGLVVGAASCGGTEDRAAIVPVDENENVEVSIEPAPSTEPAPRRASQGYQVSNSPRAAVAWWAQMRLSANWAEVPTNVLDLTESADLVALGSVSEVTAAEPIGPADGSALEVAHVSIDIDHVLKGPDTDTISLRLEIGYRDGGDESFITGLNSTLPDGSALLFLKQLDSGEYRIINTDSIWVADGDARWTPPLGTSESEIGSAILGRYADVSAIDALADAIASVAGPPTESAVPPD